MIVGVAGKNNYGEQKPRQSRWAPHLILTLVMETKFYDKILPLFFSGTKLRQFVTIHENFVPKCKFYYKIYGLSKSWGVYFYVGVVERLGFCVFRKECVRVKGVLD